MQQRPVAVFDIDGTIFRASLFLELVERLIEKGLFPPRAREAYQEEYEEWLNRTGDYEVYVEKVVSVFLSHIKGLSYEQVASVAREVIGEKKDRVYRYTRDLVKKLKREDYYLLAISHSPNFIVDAFGLELGFDSVYGFFYEADTSGNFTGRVRDFEAVRNKAAMLERVISEKGLTLEGSIGVGDTETDIPILEMVTSAIAFNPNQKLYTRAKERGWKVIVERKDVIYEL